jgi:hypothetical protein
VDAVNTACENETGNNDTIIIAPGTYAPVLFSAMTKNCSLTMYGKETAQTILSGGSTDALITAQNSNTLVSLSLTIYNLKFQNAGTGIKASSSVSITVTNSIFEKITGTAIGLTSPLTATINNNTFFQNGTAIARDTAGPVIKNNIFYGNASAVSTTIASNLSKNCYFSNSDDSTGVRETTAIKENPSFVKTDNGDYHLRVGSPCIDTGDSSVGNDAVNNSSPDVGVYGGPNMDKIPFKISGLTAVDSDATDTSIPIQWSPNECYLTTGYKIYFGTTSRTYGTPVTSSTASYTISVSPPSQTAPTFVPTLQTTPAGSGALELSWGNPSNPSDVTAYEIRYNLQTSPPAIPPAAPNSTDTVIDYVTASPKVISGLTDYTWYRFQITPFAQQTYYIAVTAYYSTSVGEFEANFSEEAIGYAGAKAYGTTSEKDDRPEPITAFPNLVNKGCFIATAAYGYYSAPQVQALREFRDRYLTTNAPGRAFVKWYYQHGPVGAQFINDHPWLKPFVRTALMPAVGGAMFMTRTSMITKTLTLFMFVLFVTYLIRRTRRSAEICGRIIMRKEEP